MNNNKLAEIRETKFDVEKAIIKWANENEHDGFYSDVKNSEPCCCKLDDLAPCGVYDCITDGDCRGGELVNNYTDSNGEKCEWAIVPHDYEESTNE